MTDHGGDAAILAWLDQEDRHVTETIRRHGCYLQYVFGEGSHPSFAYTVGLFGIGHPELIVFGMGVSGATNTLNYFFGQIRGGGDLTPGQVLSPRGANVRFWVEDFRAGCDIVLGEPPLSAPERGIGPRVPADLERGRLLPW